MLSNLHLLRYNNYYNRQLKILSKLTDYEPYRLGTITNINFIPNDGIRTKQVINWKGDIPDYLLVENGGIINSRWFVVESRRNLAGQFELELYRDTLADYYNEIQNAPIFVEKAMLDASNPLIFNQEDMTFNQIRKQPRLLYDITECPWIVGYIPKDADFADKKLTVSYNTSGNEDIEVENISDWEFASYLETPGYANQTYSATYRYTEQKTTLGLGIVNIYQMYNKYLSVGLGGDYGYDIVEITDDAWSGNRQKTPEFNNNYNGNSLYQGTYYYTREKGFESTGGLDSDVSSKDYFISKVRTDTTFKSYITGLLNSKYNFLTEATYEEITGLNGKIILDTTAQNKYRIRVNINRVNYETSVLNEQSILSKMNSFLTGSSNPPDGGTAISSTFGARFDADEITISLDQVQSLLSIPLSNDRYHLEEQPYDMFCIPFGDVKVFELEEGFRTQAIGTALATAVAEAVALEEGKDNIYDIQILPYCPVQYAWNDEYNYIDLTKTKYSIITNENGKKISALIWCRNSNFNFNIECNIPTTAYDAIDKKVRSQTEMYRLVSPNYGSAFEFNPYKNGGVNLLRVDCSYRPFNPFIRVAPIFNELYGYGGQYDSRGLILAGDFSITQLSNAWANYELQNKNYQAIFDRQIQNMEVQNKYQRINDIVNGITGSASAAVAGGMTGAMIGTSGGPYGAIAGAAVGATAGIAAGIGDIFMKEQLRNEAIDYTKDQFGYQLGNIQALPTALAKTSALTINNSLVPMLEMYDCTQAEKNAFRAKIEYNGMTVMAIGTMSQYSDGYFKGKLIRLEGISDDYHIVNTIASELNKGVYLT